MAERPRHQFILVACNAEDSTLDGNSDVLEWQTHPRDILLAESECHLQM